MHDEISSGPTEQIPDVSGWTVGSPGFSSFEESQVPPWYRPGPFASVRHMQGQWDELERSSSTEDEVTWYVFNRVPLQGKYK